MDTTTISLFVLWALVLFLGACVLALSRQIGILYERVAPMGALMLDSGPKVNDVAPILEVDSWNGAKLVIGGRKDKAVLLFFVSPTCPVCKKLIPIVQAIQRSEGAWLDVCFASDGDKTEHVAFRNKFSLDDSNYVLSQTLGMTYKVSKLPYCVLIGAGGEVRAKGLVNSREQIDSLFSANDLNVASIQDHLSKIERVA